mmetsp:Transcript_51575/g.144169  ORF Transcript_51575/g.144169 Transcript_51575/m.144169 type:complete len:152 (+) Transcript_51575:1832-2287(+)
MTWMPWTELGGDPKASESEVAAGSGRPDEPDYVPSHPEAFTFQGEVWVWADERGGSGGGFTAQPSDPLSALKSAIAAAEVEGVVDEKNIQNAKTELATQPLRAAMERQDARSLMVAIAAAEKAAEADGKAIEEAKNLAPVMAKEMLERLAV